MDGDQLCAIRKGPFNLNVVSVSVLILSKNIKLGSKGLYLFVQKRKKMERKIEWDEK